MGARYWKTLLLVISACVALATAAGAQGFGGRAFERGYREGVQQGREDARDGRAYRVEVSRVYRDGNAGYNNRDGTRDVYRDEFRRGFVNGYRNGYGRVRDRGNDQGRWDNDGWGRNGRLGGGGRGYQEPAFARGYSDGWEKGVDDGHDRDRYDPARHGDYKSADNGYERGYGSKDAYKNNYRTGFRQGYEDGYRDGGRRR
jgi:hypothetical protein